MELLDLSCVGSLPGALPSPWDPEKMMMEAVFGGFDGAAVHKPTIEGPCVLTEPHYSGASNSFSQGATWPLQALKSTECSSETSCVLVESSWAPSHHSSSGVQSCDSGSEGLPADPRGPAAAAAPTTRVTHRCRARRNQASEAPPQATEQDQQQLPGGLAVRHTSSQPPARRRQQRQRPEWASHKGPTISGVVHPFESARIYGLCGSRTLQDINAALRDWQRSS